MVKKIHSAAVMLHQLRVPLLPKVIVAFNRIVFGCQISEQCRLPSGTVLGYQGLGIVIHGRVQVGEGCHISHQVTIGGRSGHYDVPRIGNNVYIGVGAKILGPITIGENVKIGANAVVIESVASNRTVVGIPGRVVA